jgi:hypothetical protein
MKFSIVSTDCSLITLPTQVSVTTIAAPMHTIAGSKLDRLETLKVLTDRILHEDAELLRELAKL